MLPGFRFLFAAIALTMSILVFGLGAAALLRAAHEEFASVPSWRAPSEPILAQSSEASRPVLSMLRVDSAVAEQKAADNVSATTEPVEATAPTATVSTSLERDIIAAKKPEDPPSSEAAKPEVPVAEIPDQGQTTPGPADAPTPTATNTAEMKIAANEAISLPGSEVAPAAIPNAAEQISAPALPSLASTKIATLGGPPVFIDPPSLVKVPIPVARPDASIVKKARQAAILRRRIALLRARQAQVQQAAQTADPFAPQPAVQTTIPVRRARAR
jgi:hypothetical protein